MNHQAGGGGFSDFFSIVNGMATRHGPICAVTVHVSFTEFCDTMKLFGNIT